MAWSVEGRYFENCNCETPCPCTASLALGADNERCNVVLAFHIDSGEIDGVDVGDLTVVALGDSPRVMSEGNWRLGVLMDDAASDEQAEKLGALFGGELGGPMAALAPLIGEALGVERAPIEFVSEGGHHTLRAGDGVAVEVDDVVPFGSQSGEPAKLTDIFHPAGTTLTIGKAASSRVSAFGIEYEGKSAFSSAFSWSG
jgi:hypothetical protein